MSALSKKRRFEPVAGEFILWPTGREGERNGFAAENAAKTCCPSCGGEYSFKKSSTYESRMTRYCKPCEYRKNRGGWKKKVSKPLFGL